MRARRVVLALVAVLGLAGCANAAAAPERWHNGRLYLGTGNTSGVFYQFGGGYADLASKYLPGGYEVSPEPTAASGDNVIRLTGGDVEIALVNGDTAAEAVAARGPGAVRGAEAGKQRPIRALARLYPNTMNVAVRSDAKIRTLADMRGKRVSTSTLNSGTDVVAGRMLEASGLNPETDLQRLRLSLPDTVSGMKAGVIDALFFIGGLPTNGITELLDSAPGRFELLPTPGLVGPLNAKFGPVYSSVTIPKQVYRTPVDVESIAVPTLLLVTADMPDELAYQLTKVLFEHQAELAKVHPEGANFDRVNGPDTEPIPLHPGAKRFYESG
ncbi:TAXI family TRAP transporter solute-binding subunit [Planosporangium mesophilum]|uniref:C4-dicarboxylate ABC transporter substrate-binding protein n=1 Tax=Planosporangium mesophilum TaxID=689768 RepID=A0A8J3X053_9ACTN|nr:TAXI family TRAP transporter solute-binding subunit [Planosporangium mesophilum]GII22927.1 C4-dicarboxylate ABC transporter substrate-binding protein [Planosporangium mesophilum]